MSSTMDKILFFVQGGLLYTRLKGNGNKTVQFFEKIEGLVKDEIKRPKRNCDVGTAEEQEKRYMHFCNAHYNINNENDACGSCPLHKNIKISCEFVWSQMPFTKGGRDECEET